MSAKEFKIRPATTKDIPFILQGYHYINRDNPMQSAFLLTAERIHNDILAENPKAFIDVAVFGNEIIAYIFYSYVYYGSTGQNVWITNMYVDPLAQRPGLSSVGKRLIDHIAEKNPQIKGIYAVTERNNHSMQGVIARYGGKPFDNFLFIGGHVNQ